MRTVIVYDSVFENTATIARAIGEALAGDVQHVRDANALEAADVDLLVVGSPTHGGRPTPAIDAYLKAIPNDALKHVRVAAFDTRVTATERAFPLRLLMNIIGYAAPKIAKALRAKWRRTDRAASGLHRGRQGGATTDRRGRASQRVA